MSVISRTRPLDSFQHGLAEGIQILHGANEVWSAANDIVGTLPMYFTSKSTKALKDYKLYGTSEGSGVETENVYDKNSKDPENGYMSNRRMAASTGVSYSSPGHFITEYIAVKPNTIYTLDGMVNTLSSTVTAPGICFYDAEKAFISGAAFSRSSGAWRADDKQVTTPENAAYARFNIDDDSENTVMLVKDTTAPPSYIPHGYKIPLTVTSGQNTDTYPLYIGDAKLGAEEYLDYAEQKVYKRTENYFPRNIPTSSGRRLRTDGSMSSTSHWATTDYIPVSGRTFTLSPVASNYTNSAICAYDSNKNLIKGQAYGTVSDTPYDVTISCDSDVSFIRLCYYTKVVAKSTIMLVPGSTAPPTYIPYLQPTDPPTSFPAITAYEGENTLSSTETVGEVTLTGRLAKTYRQVEYLESTGTQYIDTGIVPTYTDVAETELQFGPTRDATAKQGLFGTIYDNRRFGVVMGSTSDDPHPVYFYCGYPWHPAPDTDIQITVSAATLAQKQKFVLSSAKIQLGSETRTPPAVSQSAPEKSFILFGMWDNDGQAYPFGGYDFMRCYGMTFTSGGSITHNLIPVERNSDGVLGMLDTVTNTFYTNSGTGTFNKGSYVD